MSIIIANNYLSFYMYPQISKAAHSLSIIKLSNIAVEAVPIIVKVGAAFARHIHLMKLEWRYAETF